MLIAKTTSLLIASIMLFSLIACQPAIKDSVEFSASDLSPVISFAPGAKTEEAVSYAANVEVYSSNNRSVEPPSLLRTYRMAVKIIDDRPYGRAIYRRKSNIDRP